MFDTLFRSEWRELLVALSLLVAFGFNIWSWRLFRQGLRDADHPEASARVVAAFRSGILGLGFACFAGGLWFKVGWPIGFGIFFLAEELVETGFMSLVLRGQRVSSTTTSD